MVSDDTAKDGTSMGTDDQAIFDSALADDDAPDASTQLAEAVETAKAEQAAPKPPEGEGPAPAAPSAAQDQTKPEPPQHQVSLRELLDTRERAQAAERRAQDFERRIAEFERQQRAAKEAPQEPPDMFADPQGYHAHIERIVEQRMSGLQQQQEVMATQSALAMAQVQHGETWQKAWGEFQQQANSNPQLVQEWESLPPLQRGEAVVRWYRQQSVLREVGSDPAKYRQKILDEALNDEAFLAKVADKVQAKGAQPGSRPQNVTRLPPSLNRQTSAASATSLDDLDGSDESIFEYGARKR